jgi:transcriptional regulator with XRE-family HTH domain
VSAESGVHPTEVSRIENGERDARISTVFRLAKALHVTPGQLLDGLP